VALEVPLLLKHQLLLLLLLCRMPAHAATDD
jgi:hypothetical protein